MAPTCLLCGRRSNIDPRGGAGGVDARRLRRQPGDGGHRPGSSLARQGHPVPDASRQHRVPHGRRHRRGGAGQQPRSGLVGSRPGPDPRCPPDRRRHPCRCRPKHRGGVGARRGGPAVGLPRAGAGGRVHVQRHPHGMGSRRTAPRGRPPPRSVPEHRGTDRRDRAVRRTPRRRRRGVVALGREPEDARTEPAPVHPACGAVRPRCCRSWARLPNGPLAGPHRSGAATGISWRSM